LKLPTTLVLRSVAGGDASRRTLEKRANGASSWTILRHAMLRIAAQDEEGSVAGAFAPDLGS
jgi:hypothetical protein